MSTSITQAFVKQFESEVHEAYQRQGSALRSTVRTKSGIVGSSTTFQKVGKGSATTKSRHGVIPPMNVDHTPVECTLADYYGGDWVDKLDELKTNIDERRVIANAGAYALGRKTDDLIITAATATTNSLSGGFVVTSAAAVRNAMLGMVTSLIALDVPMDGQVYGLLTPKSWAAAMTVEEFGSADYVGASGLPYTEGAPVGRFKMWGGVLWTVHTGLSGVGTSSATNLVYHKTAIGHASGADVTSDITWHGDRAAHFVNNMMSQGAVLIDANGCVKAAVDDTAAIPTT